MLETILDRHIIFVLLGILTFIGIVSKCIVNISLKRLVRAAGNMNKSTHPLMRLVRAKFEHASMVSDKVENVKVFVDKYLYEYKVLGMRLHGWRRMEKMAAGLCLLVGAAGAGLEYSVNGMDNMVWRIGATGAGLAVFVCLIHLMTDEKYQMEAVRNYMVDYLENVCLHKYEKTNQKEIKVLSQDGLSAEFGVMPAENTHDMGTDAGERNQARESYGMRNREAVREPSAVNIFHSADFAEEKESVLQDTERTRDEAVNAFRMAEPLSEEAINAFRPVGSASSESMPEARTEGRTEYRTEAAAVLQAAELIREESDSWQKNAKENIVEIPVPEFSREPAVEVKIEPPEPSKASVRAASARQVTTKERGTRREKAETEVDRDIAIRRILEEFMA